MYMFPIKTFKNTLLFFRILNVFCLTYTYPILGPLVRALFWIFGDVSSVFQSQRGFCLIYFCGGKCNVHSLRSISDATPAHLLMVSIVGRQFKMIQQSNETFGSLYGIRLDKISEYVNILITDQSGHFVDTIVDNGIWWGRSDRFNIGLICNAQSQPNQKFNLVHSSSAHYHCAEPALVFCIRI